jgi:hypothetical protein
MSEVRGEVSGLGDWHHATAWHGFVKITKVQVVLRHVIVQEVYQEDYDDIGLMVKAKFCWLLACMELVGFCTQGV